MTSHGDAIEKMSAFASRADSFVNAALDQLDDAVEQAFVGETSADVEAVQKASLTPQQQSLLRAAAAFWSDLALDAKREDWRDAATRVASAQAGAEASKRALAERAEAARREPSDSDARDALTRALTKELAAVTKRAAFAETAFMSMLNDIDEAPDPAVPLALAQDAALVVTAAARARQELEALRAARVGAAAAADELEALRGSLDARVEEAASARAREAEGRAAAAEVRAEAATRAREAAEFDLSVASRARDAAESRAFELESTRDSAAALVDLETADTEASAAFAREEIRRLRRELEAARAASGTRAPRATLDVSLDAEEARGDGDDGFGPGAVASLRDRLAVRERVAEQLKLALEEAEAAREEEREAAAARLEAAEEARVAAAETARREAEEKAGAEMAREKARAAALEARVATLRALVDAEDAETAETAARARGDGGDGENRTVYGGDTAEGRDAPLAAARARNKRLAGEAASARRDAAEATARAQNAERRASAAESAAASRDLAVAELERHLVATTGERTPETSPSADGEISAAASASLLPMVAAQRDRHKRRASELEIRVAELEASLATATEERERSRADAAALYDKVIHVQDYYHASSKTGLLAGAGAGPGGTRIVRVDDAGVALDKEDGPLAALAARRAARYGCFPGGGLRSSSIPGGDPVPLDQLPGGDPGGVLARFATMKSATSVSSGLWHTFPGLPGLGLGGKTRAAKLTRLFFVAYLGVIHVLLFRVATAGTPG
jgi:homeobox protein cut-like